MKLIVNIFEDIVASMRATGTITNPSAASGITTIPSVNSLSAGDVVTMDSTDYILLTATATNFTVTGTGITASTWTAKAPYYEFGHPLEISNMLLEKDKNDTLKYQKYPLIVLFTDVTIERGDPKIYGEIKNLFLSIIGISQIEYSSEQRYDNVIEPTLYPLYNTLVQKIQKSRYFIGTTPQLKHKLTERPFWGSSSKYGNVKNMFNDPLDALEMANISMKLREGNKCL